MYFPKIDGLFFLPEVIFFGGGGIFGSFFKTEFYCVFIADFSSEQKKVDGKSSFLVDD